MNVPGSSPHTRGALFTNYIDYWMQGIIPAYAGSTRLRSRAAMAIRDHPRIRGEHFVSSCPTGRVSGSSPHTRGALSTSNILRFTAGIIPAYAGSTKSMISVARVPRDHPRIRGEHTLKRSTPILTRGSSPHTRGALLIAKSLYRLVRIIPAYAGST